MSIQISQLKAISMKMILHHQYFYTPKEECSTAQSVGKSTVYISSWTQRYEALSKPKAHDNSTGSTRNPTGHWRLKTSPKLPCCCSLVQSCLCDPMDCSQPVPLSMGFFKARILEWVAISFSRGSSWSRDITHISCKSPTLQVGYLFFFFLPLSDRRSPQNS